MKKNFLYENKFIVTEHSLSSKKCCVIFELSSEFVEIVVLLEKYLVEKAFSVDLNQNGVGIHVGQEEVVLDFLDDLLVLYHEIFHIDKLLVPREEVHHQVLEEKYRLLVVLDQLPEVLVVQFDLLLLREGLFELRQNRVLVLVHVYAHLARHSALVLRVTKPVRRL